MKRKLQKGFTLVELIVVMILMGVIMTAVVMILRPSQRTFSNITNKAYEEQITLRMSKLLNGSLRYATSIKVVCTRDGQAPTEEELKDGTEPTDPANLKVQQNDGYFNNYIMLGNGFRYSSVKGARGTFSRGTIKTEYAGMDKDSKPQYNVTDFNPVASAISDASFDEYDFQFSIPAYNCAKTQECLTIGFKAMAMDIGDATQIAAAKTTNKPNPDFIPNFDKSYQYTETFEFLNLRNGELINKITTPLVVDKYEENAKVTGLDDDGDGYIDPRFKTLTSGDGTIWILYTNPQEALDKDSPDGGTPAPGGGTPAPGSGDSTGDGGTGTGDETTAGNTDDANNNGNTGTGGTDANNNDPFPPKNPDGQ